MILSNFFSRTRSIIQKVTPRSASANPASDLIEVAQALDVKDWDRVSELLVSIQPRTRSVNEIRLLLSFWRRLVTTLLGDDISNREFLTDWINSIESAQRGGQIWPVIRDFDRVDAIIGSEKLASLFFPVLWDSLSAVETGLKNELVSRSFLSGNTKLMERVIFRFIEIDQNYIPDYWQFQTLARRWSEEAHALSIEEQAQRFADSVERDEFDELIQIYLLILRQKDMQSAYARAQKLSDPLYREQFSQYLLGASQTCNLLPEAVALHNALTSETDNVERAFMEARLAVMDEKWESVRLLTDEVMDHRELGNTALCLRALATAHCGDFENAKAALNHVRFGRRTPWYLKGRATLIGVTVKALETEQPLTSFPSSPSLHLNSGRPLAQSLWIGPKLRWIEELSIQSFLLNGWRYKLYVYDMPNNVPDGVEVCDANSVLPRSAIFREGGKSGAHSGSLGAFSDFFRYALLSKIGGFWTDTDVINLRAFDPEGCRFIASEWTDGGLLGPNGAQMAAPANDALQIAAMKASEAYVENGEIHFAKIGPQLLAELLGEGALGSYNLLPPEFLNPVGWMETGRLLHPFEFMKRAEFFNTAHNIHVYTETWRLIGMDLSGPPQNDGFLPTVYNRIMSAKGSHSNRVMELISS